MKFFRISLTPTLGSIALALALIAPAATAGHHAHTHGKNIVETAAEAGTFTTLIAAAKAAGLVDALTGSDALTVFAPTDEAFSALPAGTIETLLKPENKAQLAKILKYHVIAGKIGSSALADGARLDTLAGVPATISAAEQGFLIQGARIVATDIDASNGVVHVIDRVILPPEQATRADAREVIRMAVQQGVPMYNHGNAEATVAIYTVAAHALMSFAALSPSETKRLEYGLMKSAHANDPRMGAWELRYALDDLNASLQGRPMAMDTMTAMSP